jgi:hypothetical protein
MCPLIKCSSQEDVHLDYQNHWPGQWTYSRGYKLVGVTQITVEGQTKEYLILQQSRLGRLIPRTGVPRPNVSLSERCCWQQPMRNKRVAGNATRLTYRVSAVSSGLTPAVRYRRQARRSHSGDVSATRQFNGSGGTLVALFAAAFRGSSCQRARSGPPRFADGR